MHWCCRVKVLPENLCRVFEQNLFLLSAVIVFFYKNLDFIVPACYSNGLAFYVDFCYTLTEVRTTRETGLNCIV